MARLSGLLPRLAGDALLQLGAHWRQHSLTLLGIVWGSSAVVLLLSLGAGFYGLLDVGFKKTGDRWLITAGGYTTTELGGARPGRAVSLTRDDLARVRAGVPSARWIAAEVQQSAAVRTPYRTRVAVVSGTTPELQWIKLHHVARGRFIDEGDEANERPVAVLGAELPEVFFGTQDPLGQTLQLDGVPFQVVGVLRAKGMQFITVNARHDQMVFIPHSRARRLFDLRNHIGTIVFDPYRLDELDRLGAEVDAALRPYHRLAPDDAEALQTFSVPEITAPFRLIALGLELLLGFIGTVMLAMAGVGVANLMVALVNRRRTEFATRRACGARRGDIVLQLLVETLVVVLTGGVLGVALGAGIAVGIASLPLPDMVPAPLVSASVVATTFAVLATVGLLSGVVPARLASRVDPSVALRVT
jgi:putative ABC transport system permease protein